MSLDVYLEIERDEPTDAERAYNLLLANGFDDFASDFWSRHSDEIGKIRFYWANITHNLNKMADAAGIYEPLWRPEEIGITVAAQLIEPLKEGLERLTAKPHEYKLLNPSNGWGDYGGLVSFIANYLDACIKCPHATVRASR